MATASPSPMPSSGHYRKSNGSLASLSRRPSSQQLHRALPSMSSRPVLKRESSFNRPTHSNSRDVSPPQIRSTETGVRDLGIGDSSDDDIPVPMKFSALTKALLDDEASL